MNLGDLTSAERVLGEALAEARAAGARDEEAVQLNNLGIVLRERGDLEGALERFGQALRIDAELKSVLGRAYDLRNIGIAEQMAGRLDQAQGHLGEALALSRSVGDRFNEVKTLAGLARLEIARGRLEPGRDHARQAYELADRLGLREVTWRALRSLGEIARRSGDLEQAHRQYARAIEVVEQMRAGLKVESFRSGFLDNKFDLYEDMVHLLLDLDRAPEAFAYSERSRARGFLDLLANRQLDVGGAGDQSLLDRVRAHKQAVVQLGERVRRAEGEELVAAEQELSRIKAELKQSLEQLRSRNPDLTDFVEVRPVEAEQIRGRLPPKVALISYYVTGADTIAFVIRSDRVRAHRLPLARAELKALVERTRSVMQTFTPVEPELRRLWAGLVAPLEADLEGATSVGVLPHGVLHYLPFSALQSGPGTYWADRVFLFQSPSASVLDLLLQREELRFGPAAGLLSVGNPDLRDPDLDLPFAEQEARAIGFELPGGTVLLRQAATEDRVRSLIGSSDTIHLASHGTFDPDSPLLSALKLAPSDTQDGDLTAMEVFSLPLSARLVTLSACQTGLGKLSNGDEIIGLNRAFLSAGAGAVVSSLWRVSDVATAVLMKRFYRNLQSLPPAQALKLAQDVVRKYFPHPAYWAGFVLTGTWR
jgi:CHAT domain-containing protein/Tfp pilus assembly protein PilF